MSVHLKRSQHDVFPQTPSRDRRGRCCTPERSLKLTKISSLLPCIGDLPWLANSATRRSLALYTVDVTLLVVLADV
jgi:hypothetical protein